MAVVSYYLVFNTYCSGVHRLKSYLTAGREVEFYITTENNTMSIQIQTWKKYKYLTAGRAEEFDTTTENNTMSLQIRARYKYKYFTAGRAEEFETAKETPDQTNVTFDMTHCIVHYYNSTQYLNLVNNTYI